MQTKVFKISAILLLSILFTNCTSVEKYNQKIAQPIPVAKLQKDINYVQHKLKRYYPSIDHYITKEQLNNKFDSLRNVINKPMTSKEFYFALSPIIASVRQGHMTLSQVPYKLSKKKAKELQKLVLDHYRNLAMNGKIINCIL